MPAITGPGGSGTSSLLRTLAGLLPPVEGDVELDGRPLASLEGAGLRRTVTLTAEDAHVLSTTVRDSLLVARGTSSDEELVRALAAVGLDGWLGGLDGRVLRLEGGRGEPVVPAAEPPPGDDSAMPRVSRTTAMSCWRAGPGPPPPAAR